MFTNCVSKFSYATKGGINEELGNQDQIITFPSFVGLKYCHFFAVCDGHGP